MWLEEIRSAWVPTQELMILIGGTAFVFGLFSEAWFFVSMLVVTSLSQFVVWLEDRTYNDETQFDRAVYWRSLPFQIIVMICSATCWVLGRAVKSLVVVATLPDLYH
mmetsp:Transcript_17309/g.26215  ORF Transcript_17309/g.26215 Transcript_17309/m.26215 type:complete len:107 (+) Transcript_17309:111-431(+)